MDTEIEKFEILLKNFERMTNAGVQVLKLNALKLTTTVFSRLIANVVLSTIFFLSILCLTIGGALYLGELFGKVYLGFLCIAGFYILIGILFAVKSKTWLENPIGNVIIRKMTKDGEL